MFSADNVRILTSVRQRGPFCERLFQSCKLRKWSYQTLDKTAEFDRFVHLLEGELDRRRRGGLTKSEREILAEREPDRRRP